MRAEDQFHLGLVVVDFEGTLAEFTAAFGYEWCAEIGGAVPLALPGGNAVLDISCVYSRTQPRLEIVRRVPGTLWEPVVGGVHHVGYWSDDVAADAAELTRQGFVTEASRTGSGGAPFAFLRAPSGLLVELVDRVARPGLEKLWGDGGGDA
ncbi:VOC family protein [Streptomyces sp. MBT65]|uniref:VOC family protein n=1 Tax=Streptomyces sp. MBT65 TaxID=1488395 RepID=UPI00190A7A64|nr:VOC family protein [Streptomyces sp. MBT65]MBK3572328.1 VOC family protein [Streptomyces sp. MBT65]